MMRPAAAKLNGGGGGDGRRRLRAISMDVTGTMVQFSGRVEVRRVASFISRVEALWLILHDFLQHILSSPPIGS